VLFDAAGFSVPVPRVEGEVLRHRLVGVQPHLRQSEFGRVLFGAREQQPTVAASLGARRDGNRLEQQSTHTLECSSAVP
jgi:hypothetical protein